MNHETGNMLSCMWCGFPRYRPGASEGQSRQSLQQVNREETTAPVLSIIRGLIAGSGSFLAAHRITFSLQHARLHAAKLGCEAAKRAKCQNAEQCHQVLDVNSWALLESVVTQRPPRFPPPSSDISIFFFFFSREGEIPCLSKCCSSMPQVCGWEINWTRAEREKKKREEKCTCFGTEHFTAFLISAFSQT